MPLTLGQGILSFIGLFTAVGGFAADFNHTHIYNPNWPPHAKYHNGQTQSLSLALGLSTLYYVNRSTPEFDVESLRAACLLASVYYVTMLMAWFFPGSLAVDPEFGTGFPQLYLAIPVLCGTGLAYWSETRRMRQLAAEKTK